MQDFMLAPAVILGTAFLAILFMILYYLLSSICCNAEPSQTSQEDGTCPIQALPPAYSGLSIHLPPSYSQACKMIGYDAEFLDGTSNAGFQMDDDSSSYMTHNSIIDNSRGNVIDFHKRSRDSDIVVHM